MKIIPLNATFVGLILYVSCLVNVANAGIITIGNLTLENVGDIYVTDTVNRVDYMRWDIVKTLNYSQLIAKLEVGGEYEGWTIAENVEANNFVNALLPSTSTCNNTSGTAICASDFNFISFSTLMGSSYDANNSRSYAFFENKGLGTDVGIMFAIEGATEFRKVNNWSSISTSDRFSDNGLSSQYPIGFQLYRSSVSVPEPSTLAIFALGMIGLASTRLKKQS